MSSSDRHSADYLLTLRSRGIREKLTDSQIVKKFPVFYGTRRFITAFTSSRHLSQSWARSILSMPQYPVSWRSILFSSHLRLGLPNGLCSGFPTKTLHTPLLSPIRATCPDLLHISLPIPYMLFSFPQTCQMPLPFHLLDLDPKWYMAKDTNREVPPYAMYEIFLRINTHKLSTNKNYPTVQ